MSVFRTLKHLSQQAGFVFKAISLPVMARSARYSVEKAFLEMKFAQPHAETPAWRLWLSALTRSRDPLPTPPPLETFTFPGAVQSWQHKANVLTLTCENAAIRLTAIAPDVIQVRMAPGGAFSKPFSYAIEPSVADWPPPAVTLTEEDGVLLFSTDALTVQIHKSDSAIDYLDKIGQPINLDSSGMGFSDDWVGLRRRLPAFSPVFGLAERAAPLNLRGRAYRMWNRDPGGRYATGSDPLYQSHPWFVCLSRDRAFGFLLDNSHFSYFDMGHSDPNCCAISANGGELRYYFVCALAVKTILQRLAELTGAMSLPPLWSLGLHQSRWGYDSAEKIRAVAAEYRRRGIPCDVLHLDIDHMQDKQVFTWDAARFPEPAELSADLRQDGFRLVAIVDPGIKADKFNPLAEEGLQQNAFVTLPDGQPFRGPVWPGDCYFPDFTNPAVRIWWGEQYRTLVEAGISGFWNDMNEPAVFSTGDSTMPASVQHHFEGRRADHAEAHNVYGMQMARATHLAASALRPNRRPFVLSRAGFTGIQRYAAVWTGDNESTWEHLALSLTMALNLGMSGVPFVGPDIGGFFGEPEPELFARWVQLAALFPFCRIHTAINTPPQEPWAFGPEVEAIAKRAIELRYRLLPALYTAFWQAARTGVPVIRPLFIDFQDDLHTHSLDNQFMMGESLLVAPVLTPATASRDVYLPRGAVWFDYWSGQVHPGGETISVDAPLDRLPLFVRAGSVVPHWPQIQHTGQADTLRTIHLHLYDGTGQSSLYEDDGRTRDFKDGHFRHTRFIVACIEGERLVVTTRVQGDFAAPYQLIEWTLHTGADGGLPTQITADGLPVAQWAEGPQPHSITFRTPIVQRLDIRFKIT